RVEIREEDVDREHGAGPGTGLERVPRFVRARSGLEGIAGSGKVTRVQAHLSEERRVLRRRRDARAAGTGADAGADLEERSERVLRRRNGEAVPPGDDQ